MEVEMQTVIKEPTQEFDEMIQDVKMRNVLEAEVEESDTENTYELIQSPRLDQIISEYRRVQESAGNEIERKRKAVRSKCDERLWMAALWRDYQLEIVKKSFDSETKQIEREYQSDFTNLKESLMQELQEERKRLQVLEQASVNSLTVDKSGNLIKSSTGTSTVESSQIDGTITTAALLAAEEQASGRRLRRREDKEKDKDVIQQSFGSAGISNSVNVAAISSTAAATASRRKQVNNIYTYNTLLGDQEILDDLGSIAKEAGSLGTSRRAAAVIKNTVTPNASQSSTTNSNSITTSISTTAGFNVSFEKGNLHYNWDIISVSDRIRIQLTSNSAPITGIVTSCTSTELTLSTSSPTRSALKINLTDLKTGKVTILTDDQFLQDN